VAIDGAKIDSPVGAAAGANTSNRGVPASSSGGQCLSVAQASRGAILRHMKVEEIAEAVAKLPPDQLARFRRWFTAFEGAAPITPGTRLHRD